MTVEPILFAFLLAMAVVIIRTRSLLAAAMLSGIFSLISAGLFTLMDAVDVAFTEAAVGAGISTVLFLGTLALTPTHERQGRFKVLPLAVVVLMGLVLLWGIADMPHYSDPGAPIHHYLAPAYIEGTLEHFHIPNIVTAVLGSYRGYDTFGETTVIFTAATGVMLLLAHRRQDEDALPLEDAAQEAGDDAAHGGEE
ncbi:MAG: DUF4040 domain-containing protein [Myxococcota bacterium]|nr:DUF4040 domain-containing protein [Myxococcota bacterium]